MSIDLEYRMLVEQIMTQGEETETRNGKVMRSFYPFVIRCEEAPIVGWRKMNHHLGIREMEWFINGNSNLNSLYPSLRQWWRPYADEDQSLGPYHYGHYYKELPGIINSVKNNSESRRHVFSCWKQTDMYEQEFKGRLTNCHSTVCQFYVSNNDTLHYKTYQRSADVMLGLPYNLIQHYALLEYVAHRANKKVGTMSYILGDAHIYESHWEAARELIRRRRLPDNDAKLAYKPSGGDFKASDFTIEGDIEFPIKTKLKMEI